MIPIKQDTHRVTQTVQCLTMIGKYESYEEEFTLSNSMAAFTSATLTLRAQGAAMMLPSEKPSPSGSLAEYKSTQHGEALIAEDNAVDAVSRYSLDQCTCIVLHDLTFTCQLQDSNCSCDES